jgi:hypothetical protein
MDDVDATVHAALASTSQPVTVLIIGVGKDGATVESRFAGVRALDDHLAGLHDKTTMSVRDNLTFSPLSADAPLVSAASGLAAFALTSACDQLVAYMQSEGVSPGVDKPASSAALGKGAGSSGPAAAGAGAPSGVAAPTAPSAKESAGASGAPPPPPPPPPPPSAAPAATGAAAKAA